VDLLWRNEADERRGILDHCIDIIRQDLMCNGDVGIVTSSWVEDFPTAYPDFSVWHKCRKFEPLMKYTAQHVMSVEPERTEETVVLPYPPREGAGPDDICP
jgi:hypothetical protein